MPVFKEIACISTKRLIYFFARNQKIIFFTYNYLSFLQLQLFKFFYINNFFFLMKN